MSYQTLKKNLETIIKNKCLNVTELERKAGLKKNNIYNITKGLSKNPSFELIQKIANAIGISYTELYEEDISKKILEEPFLTRERLQLINKIFDIVIQEVLTLDLKITEKKLLDIVIEVFKYQKSDPHEQIDKRFINWILNKEI